MATAMADETPPYSFVTKNGQVAWDAVMGFDLAPFLSGQNVAPYALAALDDLSRQLEEARIEPDPGVNPETNADRLARLAVVLQLSSEYQAMRAEDLQVAVEKKDRELDVMDEQMEQLERGGARTDTSLEAEADAARSRAEEAERRMSLQTQELEALKEQLERHVAETRESKRALDEASSRARAAEDDVKEMQERLANETRKMQAKMREDTTAAQRASQRNQEVARYQKENAMLADENHKLAAKIETLMQECVGYSETIVRLDDAAQAWRGKEADVEAAAEAIRRERDQLAAQLENTQSDLEERTEMLMTFEERFAEEHAAWKRERAELEEEAARLKHAASMERERAVSAAAPGDSPTGSARGVLASPRRQHAMSRARSSEVRGAATNGLHPDDPRYVEELEAEVAELRDLRVLLLEAYDQLEKDVGREIDIALQRQNRHHANLEAKVSMQDEALRQEHKRFKSMDRALAEAQDELAEASRRNAEYEQGVYGLSEAMRDLKALRLQVRAADQQVQDAVETSNELGRKVEDLTEETRFLRQKAGIPEDADIDLGDFKIRSKVEAAQLRALNNQLEHEVHELEEDRRRLRNELRYRAKWQGEHAAKLGLSARQLAMLEEFADALRFGQETSFTVDGGREGDEFSAQRAVDNINARAVNELEEANRHLQERLAEALERARRNGVDVDAPRVNAPLSRGGDAQQAQQAQAQFEQQQAQMAQAQFEQQQQAQFAQERAQLEQQQQARQQREVEQAAQQAQARGQDPVAAAAAMLALSQQAAAAQQQQLQQQYQAQFEQQQAQWQQAQAQAPQTVIERVVEPDPQSAAQIAELQRQLQRARAEIVRLEDGYHDAMMRSSQNYSAASNAAATQAAAMAAATQAAAFAAMSQVSRPSTPPPAPTSTESSRPVSPLVPSLSDAIQRNAHNLLSKTRVKLQEKAEEAARVKADAEAAERRAAEDVEAARLRAELERDAATAESNAAAVAATAAALAEAQRAAAAAAAAAEATASQFEQARAREHQAGQVAAAKAEETRAAQLEAEAAVRRAEEEARAAARRAEEEALAAARQAEENARNARDQARSRAEDERVARNAAQAEAAQKALAAQSEAAARALAEAQRAAMEATRAAMSAAQQLEEMRARQAVVPQLPPSPPAAAEPAARAPVPVASVAPAPPEPPTVAPAQVPVASLAPPAEPSQSETISTTTTTVVETIEAPTAAAITPAPAVITTAVTVPVEQTRETVGLTINVTPPAEAPPALPRTTSGTQADLQIPPSPRRTSGTQADLQIPPSPRRTSGTQAGLQVPPSPRRNSGSQTADLPGASSVAPPQAAAAPAPAAAAVYHPSPAAPAAIASAPMATQSDFPEEDVVAASDYAKAIAAVDRLRGERDELRVRLRKMRSSAAADEREIYELKHAVHQLGEQTQAAQHRMQQQQHEIQDMSAALQQARTQLPMTQPPTATSQSPVVAPPPPPAPEPLPPFAPAPVAAFDVSAGLGSAQHLAGASEARLREECASADRALAALASDLQAKELELEQLASEVARYDAAMREMGSTRASLYREHVRAVAGWAEERAALAERAARAETEAEACRAEAKDARSLVERLKPGAESGLKEALAAAHARLAVLQARETRLSRALEISTATEKRVAKERDVTREDLKEMSKAARERLAFHETRAEEAEVSSARLRRELENCVPRETHARVVAEAKALQARHKELLESRLESAVAASKLAAATEDAAAARAEAETAVAAARVAEARAAALETAIEKCAEDAAHPSALDAVTLRRDTAELEARLEASSRAEALARRDAARAESASADAAKDVAALEAALSAAKTETHAAREAERALVAELATRASEQKTRADAEALEAAAEEAARARADARRAEERAKSAESALADAKASADADAAELASLRAASKDMQRRSDAAAALARANEEVLRYKASEAALVYRADVAEAEADRLHGEATRLHTALLLSARQLEAVRAEARRLAAAQEEALRRVEGAVAGAADAAKAASWEKALASLREGSARREATLEAARGATSDALARAEIAETRLAAMRDEAERRDAREALVRNASAEPSRDADADDAAADLLRETRRLGEEALAAKLEAQRALRVERAAQERVAHLERVAAERESRVVQLEEHMARDKLARDVERDDAARKLRAARRDALDAAATAVAASAAASAPEPRSEAVAMTAQPSLPPAPAPRRKPDSEALAAVGAAAASGVAPAGASVETQRVVLEQIEAIRALKLRAADAEAAASAATREAAHAAATCRATEEERDALMARLEKQVASTAARGGGAQTAGEESAVAQVTAVAQSTIARLQDLVADKNRALVKAQQAMTDLRADAMEKQAEDRATIEELNELLFKQNQREIANMREAAAFGRESSAVSGGEPSGGASGVNASAEKTKRRGGARGGRFADLSHSDLVAMIDEKEVAVEALTMKYEQQRARHEAAEARLQEAADLRVGEANRVVAQASRSAGAATSAKVLETLVSRLKTQLASKEKRIAQLKDAVRELEKKLGDALTRSADVAARAAGTVSERAAARSGDDNRAAVLAEKLRRAQDALARLEARERSWNEEKRALLQEKRAARSVPRETGEASRRDSAPPRAPPRGGSASPDAGARAAAAALAAEREKTEELENRVKALTARNGKLDRLLRAERDAARDEAALKESGSLSRADRDPRSGDENQAEDANVDGEDDAGAKARREETLARWEEGVKLRKRAETLAKKLTLKTRELESAEKLVERGRNAVADAAKEKATLSAKLRAANDALAGKKSDSGDAPDPEAARALHLECEALHRELASTRRVVDVEQAGEIARLQRRVAELEELEAVSTNTAARPERSALETRVRVLETDLLSKEDAALGLRFEAEQASARADRLQRRVDELFGGRGLEKTPLSGRDAASRRAQELEDVVDALKKVVEKQQSELSTLRARLASAARSADAAKAAKQLKQTVSTLEVELASARASEEEATGLRRKCVDLERRLAAASRGRDDAATASVLKQSQAEAAEAALRLAETRDALAASQAALDAARADAARARALGSASSSDDAARLRLENADLRAELDALDPAFFDEVMEMKRAFSAQSETVQRYEATLRRWSERLGESFEPEPKR